MKLAFIAYFTFLFLLHRSSVKRVQIINEQNSSCNLLREVKIMKYLKHFLVIVTGLIIVRALLLNVNEQNEGKIENKVNIQAKK